MAARQSITAPGPPQAAFQEASYALLRHLHLQLELGRSASGRLDTAPLQVRKRVRFAVPPARTAGPAASLVPSNVASL
jgi:hypothetical protein